MKKGLKALLLVMCAIVLVVATVFTTLAFLNAKTGTLTNTFTVGSVKLGLQETEVNQYGQEFDVNNDESTILDASTGNTGNTYKLVPGQTYIKDPTVIFKGGSEKAYVFVDVNINETVASLVNVEASNGGLAVDTVNWTLVPGETSIYYQVVDSKSTDYEMPVFGADSFKLKDDFGTTTINEQGEVVTIKAYAIQYEGFTATDDPAKSAVEYAWEAMEAELAKVAG